MTPLRGIGIGLAVAGAAGVAVGAVFLAKGFSSASQANVIAMQNCAPPTFTDFCDPSVATQLKGLDQDAANQKTIGGIVLPVGAAALGVGVALIVVGKPRSGVGAVSAPSRASIVPWFGGTAGGLRGQF
jgi:hypothetical protein